MQSDLSNDGIITTFVLVIIRIFMRQGVRIQHGKIVSEHDEASHGPLAIGQNNIGRP